MLAGNKQHFTHIPSTSRSSGLKITPRPRARKARMIATIVSELSIFEQTRVFRSGSLFRGGFDDIVSGVSVFVTTVQLSEFARRNSTTSAQIHGSGKVLIVPGEIREFNYFVLRRGFTTKKRKLGESDRICIVH